MKDITFLVAFLEGNSRGAITRFAKKLGCKTAHVTNWISGKSKPGTMYIEKIATEYNINLQWLFCDKGEPFYTEQQHGATIYRQSIESDREFSYPQLPTHLAYKAIPLCIVTVSGKVVTTQIKDEVIILGRVPYRNEFAIINDDKLISKSIPLKTILTLFPSSISAIENGRLYGLNLNGRFFIRFVVELEDDKGYVITNGFGRETIIERVDQIDEVFEIETVLGRKTAPKLSHNKVQTLINSYNQSL